MKMTQNCCLSYRVLSDCLGQKTMGKLPAPRCCYSWRRCPHVLSLLLSSLVSLFPPSKSPINRTAATLLTLHKRSRLVIRQILNYCQTAAAPLRGTTPPSAMIDRPSAVEWEATWERRRQAHGVSHQYLESVETINRKNQKTSAVLLRSYDSIPFHRHSRPERSSAAKRPRRSKTEENRS